MNTTHEPAKSSPFNAFLSKFLEKNRLALIVFFSALLLFIIGYIVVSERMDKRIERSTLMAEQMQDTYLNWLSADESARAEQEETLVSLHDSILGTYPKLYASQRARFIMGDLYYEKGEWEKSMNEYASLADSFPESYMALPSLMNAGAAAEELGNFDQAEIYYRRVTENTNDIYPDIPRAYFSLGRVLEALGKTDEAVTVYNESIDRFPDSNWTNLGRDRIIYLASVKK